MDLTFLLVIAASIAIFVAAAIEVVKRTTNLPTRYLPITSIVVGIFVAIIVTPFSEYDYYTMVVAGAVAGLSACGLFDLTKISKDDSKW
ncbi:holin [Lysinibacillus odysseyi]|uniref:Holin n=1 Tax=Lysinibacillus odysseyi 34hs-1 = NBRC 100172 TaxID=1220589 RepID=A0A0A3IWI8_9BACI|nr:holin [Lysinibacillus odysseyi]KGR89159.1 hypothetical protein CD32_00635 [Lysinibacillus odysseyi 34hs-1 = NBRC 100172]